ncbi:Uncharacterised protein [Vibrio cholerae]|nr:Uncharacterised protein [Vibrio cholerae]
MLTERIAHHACFITGAHQHRQIARFNRLAAMKRCRARGRSSQNVLNLRRTRLGHLRVIIGFALWFIEIFRPPIGQSWLYLPLQ